MIGLFFITPIEIICGFAGGVVSLFGIGAAGNRNRKPGGKRAPARKGRKR